MTRVFISHSSRDRGFVENELLPAFRAAGMETWYSAEDICTSQQWERCILGGLTSCDWFLVVTSPWSARSECVKDEVHWAMGHRLGRIVPVIIGDCEPLDFHIRMPRLQQVDYRVASVEARRKLFAAFMGPDEKELAANLDVMILRPGGSEWISQCRRDRSLLPIAAGDNVRIEAILSRPAHVYVLWITDEGHVQPLYPWSSGSWDERPEREQPIDRLELPDADPTVGWPIQEGPGGIETVVLLARNEPLPETLDLQPRLGRLPCKERLKDPTTCVFLDARQGKAIRPRCRGGVDLKNPRRVRQLELQRHALLVDRLSNHCALLIGVSFAHGGDRRHE